MNPFFSLDIPNCSNEFKIVSKPCSGFLEHSTSQKLKNKKGACGQMLKIGRWVDSGWIRFDRDVLQFGSVWLRILMGSIQFGSSRFTVKFVSVISIRVDASGGFGSARGPKFGVVRLESVLITCTSGSAFNFTFSGRFHLSWLI